jgi:hypothetical protein
MPQPSTIVGWHRWILGWQFCTRHDDEEELLRKQHMGRVGFDARIFSPWDIMSPLSQPTCDVPFPQRRSGEYRHGMVPARPLYQGGQGIGLGERVGAWGGPETVWALLCVAERHATRPNGERGYSPRRHMLDHECPEAVSPTRGVVLTDLQSSTSKYLFPGPGR